MVTLGPMFYPLYLAVSLSTAGVSDVCLDLEYTQPLIILMLTEPPLILGCWCNRCNCNKTWTE